MSRYVKKNITLPVSLHDIVITSLYAGFCGDGEKYCGLQTAFSW